DEEDQPLEAVDCEAHVSMRVERIDPGAEDVGADQVDLKEDAERDRQRKRDVQPGRPPPPPRRRGGRRGSVADDMARRYLPLWRPRIGGGTKPAYAVALRAGQCR